MSNTTAEILGTPLTINKLTLKNRIILGPMAVLQPTQDGRPSNQSIAFLKRRAQGGAGAVFVGGSVATARAFRESPFSPNIRYDDDAFVPDLTRLVDELHGTGTGVAVFAQLFPAFGRMGVPRDGHGITSASPKPVDMGGYGLPDHVYIPGGRVTPVPGEATVEEIKELEQAVVDAARRAKEAGFDGIEIAAHMCYFYSSFLSPLSNFRTDEYGGSVRNRARALTDVVAAVRREIGPDVALGLRLSVNDHLPGGQGPEGFAAVTAEIAKAGLDFVALTDGNYESMKDNVTSESGKMLREGEPQGFRKALGPGVALLVSSTPDPAQAAAAIAAGTVDATMLARQLLADPDYPNKAIEGRESEIVWCDHANSCMRRLILQVPVQCHKNPEMGREDATSRRSNLAQDAFIWAAGNALLMKIADKAARALPKKAH
ncbi:NADH:flavin oxidoreductase [Pseudoclavibacter chungangensis]|uniref:NADH:flavin oxidoreductase n=1 Tax=Pseudoclavibacter chungangensis TaxID=587635 RepID=A0A7J5BMN9_9MICO|nr:NADH:flavin oxidoreductase [Pseudoclavibacter chungangensis]KAB1652845.1 NADH:flavin oxidoreductase [Pseudoclavibacter chungangensis]NYJ67159.1 2,4-dienoyl-CoA reductase (NADPH2) [Pseudoclavibacter chungangensis]